MCEPRSGLGRVGFAETIADMKAPPSQIVCKQCEKPVMVPPTKFDWACASCTFINKREAEKCASCNTLKPDKLPTPTMICTMCNATNEVPSTTAQVKLQAAAKATKEAATTAATKAKEEYKFLKATPEKFNCEHCHCEQGNPNFALQQRYEAQAAAAQPPPPAVVEVTQVVCSVCKKQTSVPGSNFTNKVKASAASAATHVNKAYMQVTDKRFVSCPICNNPCPFAEDLVAQAKAAPAPQPLNNAPASAGPSAPPPQFKPVQVQMKCEKCNSNFPAVFSG